MTAITYDILRKVRQRRSRGERVCDLAAELGISRQKLDKLIRHGLRGHQPVTTLPTPGALTERYRTRNFKSLYGQDRAVKALRVFARAPYPAALLAVGAVMHGLGAACIALRDIARNSFRNL